MSLLNLLGVGHSAVEMAELQARKSALAPALRAQIEAEGGSVTRVRSLNSRLVLGSPFPSKLVRVNRIGGRPVLLEVECAYPTDAGRWFIQAPADDAVQWVWCSDGGRDELPVPRDGAAHVAHGVVALPLWVGALLYLALVAAAFTVVIYFLGDAR